MTHTVTVRGSGFGLRFCDSCGTEHIGVVPCGMTFRERLCTTRLDGSVTETRNKRNYYEDESYKELFGGYDRKERREKLMDDTHGYGPLGKSNDPKHFKAVMGFDPTDRDD